ncbi:YgfZ/GcvT domain-containing protein [Prosthecobacter sp.]|uniref:CAF17-like 4Fe-4S cluster assembly/insertion protein YgfZ n=1 Tax=Prosthecobacter sp. TaxID=1965333 RepID=UPI0037842C0E
MTTDVFQTILQYGAAVNLSARAKFQLTGNDRVRYLNGQVTNDVRRAKNDETLYACVTDAKGRVAGDVFIHTTAVALLIDAEPGLRESLGMRLERYIVADDAELADVTDGWQLWHVWGDAAAPVPEENALGSQESPHHVVRSNRFGVVGADLWIPSGTTPPAFDSLPVLSESELETWRVLQNIPRWPNELNAETFPPEAGLEARAMDFAKGCYIGQEVLSRIKTTGKMPRNLVHWESGHDIAAGTELHDPQDKVIGTVTSVAKHPLTGKFVIMAMVKAGTNVIAERDA